MTSPETLQCVGLTPFLNAILGFSEILASKLKDPRHREYIQAVHSSGKSLLSLINDILDLSKVEAGKLDLELAAIDPRTTLKELATIFSRKVEEKGLTFSTDVAADFPKAVVLDEARLRQVLLNLVGNALKFTEHGFVRMVARVQPGSSQEGLHLVFEVHDSGVGIPADQLESIFGAFEQQRGQSHAKYGGTGLGLTISRRLVELMGGQITVESTVGKGSVFRVTLHNVEEAALAQRHDTESAACQTAVVFEPATILVAEDVSLNRELIKGFLEGFHLQILEAVNGRQAVDLAQAQAPALILMDIKMPELDGLQATRLLKEDPATRQIPIVAVTASTMKLEEEKIGAICDGFLRKPITQADLLNVLVRFLKHSAPPEKSSALPPPEALVYDTTQILDPEGLEEKLATDLTRMWQDVKDPLIVNQVLEFAEKTIAIAVTHKHSRLAAWGDKLRNQAMLFDMAGMEQTLEQFPAFQSLQPLASDLNSPPLHP